MVDLIQKHKIEEAKSKVGLTDGEEEAEVAAASEQQWRIGIGSAQDS